MKKTTMKKSKSLVCRFIIAGILALGLVLSCSEPEPTPTDEGLQGKISSTSWENDLYEYLLSAQGGGKTSDNSVLVKIPNIQLTESNYLKILMLLEEFGDLYKTLDLADCDFSEADSSGGLNRNLIFNPMPFISTGKSRIVKLVLPTVSTGINASFAFYNSLREVTGENISTLGSNIFSDLTGLESVTFQKLSSIGYQTFKNCKSLTKISLLASAVVTQNPFIGCQALEFQVIGEGALSVESGGKILLRNKTQLVSYPSASGIIRLNNLTALGEFSMSETSSTEAAFEGVVTMAPYAFYNCPSLASISLPKAINLGGYSLYGCSNISKISVPNVNSIGPYALASTGNSFIEIELGSTPPDLGPNLFNYSNTKVVTLMVPSSSAENYDEGWINAFIGKGSAGTGTINENLTLKIERYTP
jgi:hypothetical protein